jgi:hypothetical protein
MAGDERVSTRGNGSSCDEGCVPPELHDRGVKKSNCELVVAFATTNSPIPKTALPALAPMRGAFLRGQSLATPLPILMEPRRDCVTAHPS